MREECGKVYTGCRGIEPVIGSRMWDLFNEFMGRNHRRKEKGE